MRQGELPPCGLRAWTLGRWSCSLQRLHNRAVLLSLGIASHVQYAPAFSISLYHIVCQRIQQGLEARHTPGRALVVRGAGSRACVCVPCRECRERRDHIISQSQQKRQAREDKQGQGVVYT